MTMTERKVGLLELAKQLGSVEPEWDSPNTESTSPPNTITVVVNETYPKPKLWYGPYTFLNWR
jgi:hypothetical protein